MCLSWKIYTETMQDLKQIMLVTVLVLMTTGACLAASAETSADPEKDDAPVDQEQIKKYLSMMDKLNIDQILNNTRLMINHIKCFLNEGPCTAQLKEMKKVIPMLIKDSCSSCTKDQKKMVKKAIDRIKEQRPLDYEKLSKFFDPQGKYEKKFMENLKELEQSD